MDVMFTSQSLEKCEVAKNLAFHICLMVVMVVLIGGDVHFPVPGKVGFCNESHISHCRRVVLVVLVVLSMLMFSLY